jgi:hypothetical protein
LFQRNFDFFSLFINSNHLEKSPQSNIANLLFLDSDNFLPPPFFIALNFEFPF